MTETDTTPTRRGRTLDQRMAWVQKKLEDVPRRGHADVTTRSGGSYSYDYILEADLMSGIRPLLAEAGIAFYYSDKIVSVEQGAAHVRIQITLAANGETREFTADGYATDLGDKHVNKAKTGAMRYWLWKTFLQPSDEDDPEHQNITADGARKAEEARQRAANIREGTTTKRTTDAPGNTAGLLQRISTLAVELDGVQDRPAGRNLGSIMEQATELYGAPLGDLEARHLVAIGQALASHVEREKATREREGLGYDPLDFKVPDPQ